MSAMNPPRAHCRETISVMACTANHRAPSRALRLPSRESSYRDACVLDSLGDK